jgi:uncharacterized membrane protein (UPF0127 family)
VASKLRKIVNLTNGNVVADRVRTADTFTDRLLGLLKSPPLEPGEGLIIQPCSSIHMFGMKFAIDVIFYDRDHRVVAVVDDIKPGQMSAPFLRALGCVELPSGTARDTNTRVGDQLELSDV